MHRKGLSLIELLLVLSILGVLTAIVIPKYTDASGEAKVNAAETQLRLIRDAIERYKLDHGTYPAINNMWEALTEKTDADGAIVATGQFGPYLTEPPQNPWTMADTVELPGSADGGSWAYDPNDGAVGAVGFDEEIVSYKTVNFVKVRTKNGDFRLVNDSN